VAREERPHDDRMDPLNTEFRYLAARCAALAGCGLGNDGAKLGADEQAHWRKQAREWLRADLAAWSETLASGSPMDHELARKMLKPWQAEPDLAGLREPQEIDKLSPDERRECEALWHEVRELLHRTFDPPWSGALDPKHTVLLREGRLEEARFAWQSLLACNP